MGAPVLLVRGERDRVAPQRWVEELDKRGPDSHIVVIPRAGHTVVYSEPVRMARVIQDFTNDTGTLVTVDSAGERVETISAVTLVTSRMAASVSFYESLGLELLHGGGDAVFTSFRVGDGYLNIQRDDRWTPPPVVWGRVIFHVGEVDAMYERAIAAGLTPATEPADAPWGERFFHIRDPDGHELSFVRPLPAQR